jgi:hypothetical protein
VLLPHGNKWIDLIDNHHGVRNPHPSLQDTGSNQSSPVTILMNTSPLTPAVSFGLGIDVFVTQHGHNTNHTMENNHFICNTTL